MALPYAVRPVALSYSLSKPVSLQPRWLWLEKEVHAWRCARRLPNLACAHLCATEPQLLIYT
eukprot:14511925-Alexandrium_andersonii.AAC.1